jgi:L-lactate dehydrogenase (cytochrome)
MSKIITSATNITGKRHRTLPARAIAIEDLRLMARRRLPKVVFDYVDGGADAEVTLNANRAAFDTLTFRPRHAVAVPQCNLQTRVLGRDLALPVLLAPVAYSGLIHTGGELAAAQAASKAGTVYILSTLSGQRIEEIRAGCAGSLWYQVSLLGGREAAEAAIERAKNAGFSALVVTIDSPTNGNRERDLRNGVLELVFQDRLLPKIPFLWQLLARPTWLADFWRNGGMPPLQNVLSPGGGPTPINKIGSILTYQVTVWEDLRWIRACWNGPIVVKGVLTGDDARRAIYEGAGAVVVSNHGGRQLDGVQASLRALPEVVAAVNGEAEVMMDGGVRRGTDVIKAICLGARAVLCGRAYAYGLGAAGEAGVARALAILRSDLDRTLRLLGCESTAMLDRSYVD